jgi:hypothetical protein
MKTPALLISVSTRLKRSSRRDDLCAASAIPDVACRCQPCSRLKVQSIATRQRRRIDLR